MIVGLLKGNKERGYFTCYLTEVWFSPKILINYLVCFYVQNEDGGEIFLQSELSN